MKRKNIEANMNLARNVLIAVLVVCNLATLCLAQAKKEVPIVASGQRLLEASRSGDAAKVSVLLTGGADANTRAEEGATSLMIAAARGHLDVAKALLAQRADVNAQDEKGRSALMFAVFRSRLSMVDLLLEKGADPNLKDKGGAPAFVYGTVAQPNSEGSRHQEVLELLASKGLAARVNTQSPEGTLQAALWIMSYTVPPKSCFDHVESPPCPWELKNASASKIAAALAHERRQRVP